VTKVTETTVPDDSALQPWLAGADFYDAYQAPLTTATLSPTEIFLRASRTTPRWVEDLMAIRNRIVRLFGLKDVGAMKTEPRSADSYQVGDRLGIFSIFGKTENELLLGIDDSHLDVRVSVLKIPAQRHTSLCPVDRRACAQPSRPRLYGAGRPHPSLRGQIDDGARGGLERGCGKNMGSDWSVT
jgi:hypothetical protein